MCRSKCKCAADGPTGEFDSREADGSATHGASTCQTECRRMRDGRKRKDICSIFGFGGNLTGRGGRDDRPNYDDIVEYCKEGWRASATHGTWRPRKEPRFAES